MVLKKQRSREDRRTDTKRRNLNDSNVNKSERRNIACRRSGEERRAK